MRTNWDEPGTNTFEAIGYEGLPPNAADKVKAIGFTEETWDCWMNHYEFYDWSELETKGVQHYFEALGWTSDTWNRPRE